MVSPWCADGVHPPLGLFDDVIGVGCWTSGIDRFPQLSTLAVRPIPFSLREPITDGRRSGSTLL
jgi:hypothetical protein